MYIQTPHPLSSYSSTTSTSQLTVLHNVDLHQILVSNANAPTSRFRSGRNGRKARRNSPRTRSSPEAGESYPPLDKPPVRIADTGAAKPGFHSAIRIQVRALRAHCHGDCARRGYSEMVDSVAQNATRNSSGCARHVWYFHIHVWFRAVFLCL